MNNSKIAIDSVIEEEPKFEKAPLLQERRAELTNIIQAIEGVIATKDWQLLRKKLFDPAAEQLEKLLKAEMKKKPVDAPQIYYLQGQLHWADKRANLEDLNKQFKVELKHIKQQING